MASQKERITALLQLSLENPELPVIPMVNSEVVADDMCANWLGSWGVAEVTKYLCGRERVYFYDEHDMEETLLEFAGDEWYEKSTPEMDLEKYRSLAWVDCITVYIDTPEV